MATDVNDLSSYQQFALEQQQMNNEWSAKQAEINRNWQAEMSNTAHQREVADLKAAGLNPILSANSGASVGSGAVGETDTSAAGNVGAILQQVLQAQSAREVAGMYNAATIAAATIAANASMYGVDKSFEASTYATDKNFEKTPLGFVQSVASGKNDAAKNFFGMLSSGLDSILQLKDQRSAYVGSSSGHAVARGGYLDYLQYMSHYKINYKSWSISQLKHAYKVWKSGNTSEFLKLVRSYEKTGSYYGFNSRVGKF